MEQLLHWVEITPEIIAKLDNDISYAFKFGNKLPAFHKGVYLKLRTVVAAEILLPVPVSKVVSDEMIETKATEIFPIALEEIRGQSGQHDINEWDRQNLIEFGNWMRSTMSSPPVNQNSEPITDETFCKVLDFLNVNYTKGSGWYEHKRETFAPFIQNTLKSISPVSEHKYTHTGQQSKPFINQIITESPVSEGEIKNKHLIEHLLMLCNEDGSVRECAKSKCIIQELFTLYKQTI
mgnify:CR=1 FL=1